MLLDKFVAVKRCVVTARREMAFSVLGGKVFSTYVSMGPCGEVSDA